MRRLAIVCMLVGLFVVGAPSGGASAAMGTQMATLYGPVYAPTCTPEPPPPPPSNTFGSVIFIMQSGGAVRVVDRLMGANPDSSYRVDLWTMDPNGGCNLQVLGYISTNTAGVGVGTFVGTLDSSTFELTNFDASGNGNWLLSTQTQMTP